MSGKEDRYAHLRDDMDEDDDEDPINLADESDGDAAEPASDETSDDVADEVEQIDEDALPESFSISVEDPDTDADETVVLVSDADEEIRLTIDDTDVTADELTTAIRQFYTDETTAGSTSSDDTWALSGVSKTALIAGAGVVAVAAAARRRRNS